MQSIDRVEVLPPSGNTLARLVRGIEEKRLVPTHFLILQTTYHKLLERKLRNRVPRAYFAYLNQVLYSTTLPGDDESISIRWHSFNSASSQIYWTKSRLDEMYVRKLTKGLLLKAHAQVLQDTCLQRGNFQTTWLVVKNVTFTINEDTDEETALQTIMPATPRMEDIEAELSEPHEIDEMW